MPPVPRTHRPLALCTVLAVGTGLGACNDYDIIQQPLRETFHQTERDKVDLVFVVDDSPSMLEEAAQVRVATQALLAALVALEVDTEVSAVAMTAGPTLPAQVLDATAQIPELVDRIAVPPEGGRTEAGLAVAVEAVAPRSDAVLHVVLVSDEDDQSSAEVATLVDQLSADAPLGLRVHSIAGDLPAGCARDGVAADPAPRYRAATDQTDGHAWSICSATLADDIAELSFELTGLQRVFPLASLPDPGTLEVWVEGATVPQGPVHAWRWSAPHNALVFDGLAIPPPGARVEVEYTAAVPEAGAGLQSLPDVPSAADSG